MLYYTEHGRYAKLVEEIEEKCLKKSRHFPAKEAIYETPSDYDPLALNMGQLVVHRISLRFTKPIWHHHNCCPHCRCFLDCRCHSHDTNGGQVQVWGQPTAIRGAMWQGFAFQTSGHRIWWWWWFGQKSQSIHKTFKSGLAGLHGGTRRLPGKKISDWRSEIPSSATSVTLDFQPNQILGPGGRRFSFLEIETQNPPFKDTRQVKHSCEIWNGSKSEVPQKKMQEL